VVIDDEWYDSIRESLPELPEEKFARYTGELGLNEYDAAQLIKSIALCECFEAAYAVCGNAKEASNWMISEVMSILNQRKMTYDMLNVNGTALGELIKLVMAGEVGRANGKKILAAMFDDTEIVPAEYAKANGYIMSNDVGLIEKVVKEVIASEEKAVNDYKNGKEKALMSLFGRCMKELKGNCDPQVLKSVLTETLNNQ